MGKRKTNLLLLFASLKKKNIWIGELHGKCRADWKGKRWWISSRHAPPSLYIRWSAAGLCWAAGPVKITWLYRAQTHTQERERERGKESIYTHTSRCIGKKASIQSHLPRTDRQQSFSVYTTDPLLLLSTKRFPVFFLFPFFLLVVGWIFIASKEKSRPLLPPHIGSDRYRHIRHPSAL